MAAVMSMEPDMAKLSIGDGNNNKDVDKLEQEAKDPILGKAKKDATPPITVAFCGRLRGHFRPVTQLVMHPRYDILISSGKDGSIGLWGKTTTAKGDHWRLVDLFFQHGDQVTDVSVSHDGNFAVSASMDKSVILWDLTVQKVVRRFENAHKMGIMSVSFSYDSTKIATGSQDWSVKLWNINGKISSALQDADGHLDCVRCVRFNPAKNHHDPDLLLSCGGSTLNLWSVSKNKCYEVNESEKDGQLNALVYSKDGKCFASGGLSSNVRLWTLRSSEPLRATISTNRGVIRALNYSSDGQFLAAAVGEGVVIWAMKTFEVAAEIFPNYSANCTCVTWSRDGKYLFAGFTDSTIAVFSCVNRMQHCPELIIID